MGLFNNLFGRKKSESRKEESPSFKPAALPAKKNSSGYRTIKDPNLIKVFVGYGREMYIPKEEWRTKVLPDNLKSNWNNADQLGGLIVSSLNDGFFPDVLDAAAQLHRIDSPSTQSTCIYAIVLIKNRRVDEAEKVLRNCPEKHREDGSVLTNLAKVYSEQNEPQKSLEILWHALEVDSTRITAWDGMKPSIAKKADRMPGWKLCAGLPHYRAVGVLNCGWPGTRCKTVSWTRHWQSIETALVASANQCRQTS